MPTVNVSFFEGRSLLDLRSYGRHGPGRRDHLSPAEIAQISRTVRRVPEVVVKVLPRDSNNFSAVGRHLDYIGRKGELELETGDGERLSGRGVGRELLDDWDLDLDEHRRTAELGSALGRKPPKLVHKLMLSMPPGTPAEGVLAAARNLLREEFALKHRYAFVLHTDEPHPHVHAVVKAVSEQGIRLNIRKATLRAWRASFARHLREQGIEANATERAVRGEVKVRKIDQIFRAHARGASSHMRAKVEGVGRDLGVGRSWTEPGKRRMLQTRNEVERGWRVLGNVLKTENHNELSLEVERFVAQMPPPRTEREQIAHALGDHIERLREKVPVR